jgi:ribose/xylose/arabinose/galactoside ABC-type transport system permease subunit
MERSEDGSAAGGIKQQIRRLLGARELGLVIAILFISLALHLFSANFLFVLSRQISFVAIIAVGMTFVILTAGIDLSVGSVVALVSVVTGYTVVTLGLPVLIGIPLALGAGAIVGLINGALVVKTGVHSFVITLGMLGIARGVALGTTGGSTTSGFDSGFLVLGQGAFIGIPIPVIIAAVVAVGAHIVLSRTAVGRHVYFVGSNEEAATLSGIKVGRIKLLVFTVASTLAALSAVIETSRLATAQPAAGTGYELIAIGAVIIGGASLMGGVGTILGTVLGATLLGLVTNGLVLLGVSTFWQQAVTGAIIILAVTLNTYRQRKSN